MSNINYKKTNRNNYKKHSSSDFKKKGNGNNSFTKGKRGFTPLPDDRNEALKLLCNTPQFENKVEEEKMIFLYYLNIAVTNIQNIFAASLKKKNNNRNPLPFKEDKLRQRLESLDDETIAKIADFLWLFKVSVPGRDYKDFRKITIELVCRIFSLRNLFVHPSGSNISPLLTDRDLYVFLEGELKADANMESIQKDHSNEKQFKMKLLNNHADYSNEEKNIPEKDRIYEFTRKGLIFLTCLALYKDEAQSFCRQFDDMKIPDRCCVDPTEECLNADCQEQNNPCKIRKAKDLIEFFSTFSYARRRRNLNIDADYIRFSDIIAYLNKVPAAAYNHLELKDEKEMLQDDAAESNESEENKKFKYELHKRFKDRFLSFAAGYCEDFNLFPCVRFKRLDTRVSLDRQRFTFGPDPAAKRAAGTCAEMVNMSPDMDEPDTNRHFIISNDEIGFEYRPEIHYGADAAGNSIKISSIRGRIHENELKYLIWLDSRNVDVNAKLEAFFSAYHRILEKMLNTPEGDTFDPADYEDDLCTVAGVSKEVLNSNPHAVLKPFFPDNLVHFLYGGEKIFLNEDLHKRLCELIQVKINQGSDFLNTRIKPLNALRFTPKEQRPDRKNVECKDGVKFFKESEHIPDGELIEWVFNYLNLFLKDPEDKFRLLPRGERHSATKPDNPKYNKELRDHEYQMLHAMIGKYAMDQKGFPGMLHKLRPKANGLYQEKVFTRRDGTEVVEYALEEPLRSTLERVVQRGRDYCKKNPRKDKLGREIRYRVSLIDLAEAAVICYQDVLRNELNQWKARQPSDIDRGVLEKECRRFGGRVGMPMTRDSLIKIILKIDYSKWVHAYDYKNNCPYRNRSLASGEHIVPQVNLPAGFAQRLADEELLPNKSFKAFVKNKKVGPGAADDSFDLPLAFKKLIQNPISLRDYYTTLPLINQVRKIIEENREKKSRGIPVSGATQKKAPFDKAMRSIAKAQNQDLLLCNIAFRYRTRSFENGTSLPFKVRHEKSGSVYNYFKTPDEIKLLDKLIVKLYPNDFAKQSLAAVFGLEKQELLKLVDRTIASNTASVLENGINFFDLQTILNDMRNTDRKKAMALIPLLIRFEENVDTSRVVYSDNEDENHKNEFPCYLKQFPALTFDEFKTIVKYRNSIYHSKLALDDPTEVTGILKKHLGISS